VAGFIWSGKKVDALRQAAHRAGPGFFCSIRFLEGSHVRESN
jgi:hypothetical protein